MLSATPTQVVPRMPSAGISQKPAAVAPSAAPDVFAAYNAPAPAAAVSARSSRDVAFIDAIQAAAIGNVAPMAAAGTPSSARLSVRRTRANRAGASPSA